jgi:predicted ATP-grasp superfamily ATP-dependent carboligase
LRGPDRSEPAPARGDRLLLIGASVRSLAQSVLRSPRSRVLFPGGILALDFFGDADLDGRPVEIVSIRRDLGLDRTIADLGRAALDLDWKAVAPAGGLENRPGLLRLLARRGRLLGSAPEAIRAVRDPGRLFAGLAAEGLPHAAAPGAARVPRDGRAWLVKRRRGAGGGGVRAARPGEPVPPGSYLQERLDGRPGSAAFLADANDAVLLGVCEQLVGSAAPGAGGFRHAGNLVDAADLARGPAGLLDGEGEVLARRIATWLTRRFGLCGLAGFDFIALSGRPHVIEVNPRWTASMELTEEARGASLFEAMLSVGEGAAAAEAAPDAGVLAGPRHAPAFGPERILGREVLYAPETMIAPPPATLAALGVRDRPRAGEVILPGRPVCTLTARAATRDRVLEALEASATRVRALLAPAAAKAERRQAQGASRTIAVRRPIA